MATTCYHCLIWLLLLASLIVIYRKAREVTMPTERLSWWFMVLPFSLYLGWITVAAAVNASVVLLWLGWDGAGLAPVFWAAMLVGMTCALSLFMSYRYRDVVYTCVIVWAIIGIAVKQSACPELVAACFLAILALSLSWALPFGSAGLLCRFSIRADRCHQWWAKVQRPTLEQHHGDVDAHVPCGEDAVAQSVEDADKSMLIYFNGVRGNFGHLALGKLVNVTRRDGGHITFSVCVVSDAVNDDAVLSNDDFELAERGCHRR